MMTRRKATVRTQHGPGYVLLQGHTAVCVCELEFEVNKSQHLTPGQARKMGQALIDIAETVERDRGKS